jgi:peptidoglycan hydrolase-like protein with peptidoglycan-binding domain
MTTKTFQPPRRLSTALAAALAGASLLVGCGHARTVDPATTDRAAAGAHEHEQTQARATEERLHRAARERPAADVPIAASPADLLKPGAEQRIQERLASEGLLDHQDVSGKLDGKTRQALRRFQQSSDLPATGVPDQETVRKLGLDPEQTFRSQSQ